MGSLVVVAAMPLLTLCWQHVSSYSAFHIIARDSSQAILIPYFLHPAPVVHMQLSPGPSLSPSSPKLSILLVATLNWFRLKGLKTNPP
jgi:hypothetical protein